MKKKPKPGSSAKDAESEKSQEYQAFEAGMKAILKVPKKEIERLEAEEKSGKTRDS